MLTLTRSSLLIVAVLCGTSALPAQEKPTPASSLQRLKDGNGRFAADKASTRDVGAKRRIEVAKGQHPYAIVLTCADSRVSPELIFDAGIGELFVLRVAGNIADPAVVGSIEYAVEHLHCPLIVVMGHESCGAVAAAIDGGKIPGDLGWLVKQVKVGKVTGDKDAKLAAGVRNNVRAAAMDLDLRSKIIHEEVKEKKVMVVSGVYSLKTGKVEWLAAPVTKKVAEPEKAKTPATTPPKTFEPEKTKSPGTTPPKSVEPIAPPKALPSSVTPGTTVQPGPTVEPGRFPRLRAFFARLGSR